MKLIVTVGLPRSGKSTWARTTGWPIVNPDSIRLALHGQRFYGPAEPFVWAMAHAMVEALRLAGHTRIIVDATNVTPKRRAEWEAQYPGAVEFKVIEATPEECIARAEKENDAEIIPVIRRMAAEWDVPCQRGGSTPTAPGHACCADCEAEIRYPSEGAPSSAPVDAPGVCGAADHPVFVYPCVLPKGHAGPHDNGSGDPWESKP